MFVFSILTSTKCPRCDYWWFFSFCLDAFKALTYSARNTSNAGEKKNRELLNASLKGDLTIALMDDTVFHYRTRRHYKTKR